MNARQKAKKLKKENERLTRILNPHINPIPIMRYELKPERLKMKLVYPIKTPMEIVKKYISKSAGEYLLDNGFINVIQITNEYTNQFEFQISMMAVRNPWKEGDK